MATRCHHEPAYGPILCGPGSAGTVRTPTSVRHPLAPAHRHPNNTKRMSRNGRSFNCLYFVPVYHSLHNNITINSAQPQTNAFSSKSRFLGKFQWLELGLVWTEFGKLRQQHRGFCTDFESLVFIDFIQTSQSTLDANIHDKKHKHC